MVRHRTSWHQHVCNVGVKPEPPARCWQVRSQTGALTDFSVQKLCLFHACATSAPAEGPLYRLDLTRHREFSFRTLQAQKWHVHGSGVLERSGSKGGWPHFPEPRDDNLMNSQNHANTSPLSQPSFPASHRRAFTA